MHKETKFVLEAPVIGWGVHSPNKNKTHYAICYLDPEGEHCSLSVPQDLFRLANLPNKILKIEVSVVN